MKPAKAGVFDPQPNDEVGQSLLTRTHTLTHIHSLTHTYTHTHTHNDSLTLNTSHSHSYSTKSLSCLSCSLCQSHTLFHPFECTYSLFFVTAHTHAHAHSTFCSGTLTQTLNLAHTCALSLNLGHTHTQSLFLVQSFFVRVTKNDSLSFFSFSDHP